MNIDLDKINNLIEEGYINKNTHHSDELFIYNYSAKSQYEKMWTPETLMCRGLILDKKGEIIARPFKKFFNYEEHFHKGTIPVEPFDVYEKMDGSLGILYFYKEKPYIATRGCFDSKQALRATDILYKKYEDKFHKLNPTITYLLEIIYPENRIVVDYGESEELILLGANIKNREEEICREQLEKIDVFPLVKKYEGYTDINLLKNINEKNKEGFVIHFKSGLRIKCKFDEYVKLHSFITEASSKKIWEMIKDEPPPYLIKNDIIEKIPDEIYKFVEETRKSLINKFEEIKSISLNDFDIIKDISSRKEFALEASKTKYPHVMFKMFDNKDYEYVIWNLIEPKNELPKYVE